jgi:hypothetical protein
MKLKDIMNKVKVTTIKEPKEKREQPKEKPEKKQKKSGFSFWCDRFPPTD